VKRLFIVNALSARVARKGSVLESLASESGIDCFFLDPFDTLPSAVSKAAKDGIEPPKKRPLIRSPLSPSSPAG